MFYNSSGAGAERELIMQSSRLHLTMYVCMYVCMLSLFRNAIMDFMHAHTGTITHALVGRMAPQPDKKRTWVKHHEHEAQRLKLRECERTLDVRGGDRRWCGERAETIKVLARSRRKAKDVVIIIYNASLAKPDPYAVRVWLRVTNIVHGPTDGGPWPSGCKRPFTDRVDFCSAPVVDFISKWKGVASCAIHPWLPLISPWCDAERDLGGWEEQRLAWMRDGYKLFIKFFHTAPRVNYTMSTPSY